MRFLKLKCGVEKRINLWSAPRCSSTSLMYSFAQRSDCAVCDEPLYPAYLKLMPNVERPYREELLQTHETDPQKIIDEVILGNGKFPNSPNQNPKILFFKNIVKTLMPSFDREFLGKTTNFMLVRHPYKVFASYYNAMGDATIHDTGLKDLVDLKEYLENIGQTVPVVENETLLSKPEETLKELCDALDIEFQPAMLKWEKGGRPEDGMWAYHWYKGTHKQQGFSNHAIVEKDLDSYLEGLPSHIVKRAEESVEYYQILAENSKAIKNDYETFQTTKSTRDIAITAIPIKAKMET